MLLNGIEERNEFYVIGLMSGTSLDGLDIAYCHFTYRNDVFGYKVLAAETIEYDSELKSAFQRIENSDAAYFCEWDRKTGKYFGEQVIDFMRRNSIAEVDFISSHGHTIFHQPEKGFTVQIGHGASLGAACGLPVICDFRSLDVALGGQGAPLVPIGDQLLFAGYDFCLNLGGIANISFQNADKRMAFDIVPVNMILNKWAQYTGLEFDKDGELASKGNVDENLLNKLNALSFYEQSFPKSLGKEWVLACVIPIIEEFVNLSINDVLATFCEHVALQISKVVLSNAKGRNNCSLLATGGGALNNYLMSLLKTKLSPHCELIIPDEKTLKFKEAIIFAFLGILRVLEIPNSLRSVTGAAKDNVGGCVYL